MAAPKVIDPYTYVEGAKPPKGISVEFVSDIDPVPGRFASDYAYFDDAWTNFATPEFWREHGGKNRDRERAPIREAILALDDVYLGSNYQIVTGTGYTFASHKFITRSFSGSTADITVDHELSGTWGSMVSQSANYGHWILQRLPRLHTVQSHFPGVPMVNSEWRDDALLTQYGVDPANLIRLPSRVEDPTYVHIDRLLLATHLAPSSQQWAIDAPRLERLAEHWGRDAGEPGGTPELLYLERQENVERPGASNKSAIRDVLVDRGFTPWDPMTVPNTEQIRRIRGARVIVAEQGSAALTSMFAHAGLTVIIISPNVGFKTKPVRAGFDPLRVTWQRLTCEARGQHYANIESSPVRSSKRGWEVDIDILTRALDSYPLREW